MPCDAAQVTLRCEYVRDRFFLAWAYFQRPIVLLRVTTKYAPRRVNAQSNPLSTQPPHAPQASGIPSFSHTICRNETARDDATRHRVDAVLMRIQSL